MTLLVNILLLWTFLATSPGDQETKMVVFYWTFAGDTLASINVPPGYQKTDWEYGEGIATTLKYPDSSFIVLHYGFTMSLPLLKSPHHLVYAETRSHDRTIRFGRVQNTRLRWREESLSDLPINIGFSGVPSAQLKTFDRALKSLKILRK
jgi:hypothetical protein